MTPEEIKRARLEIEGNRMANNKLFMDWWEVTMSCPHCSPYAARYQSVIRRFDNQILEANKKCE